MTSNKSPKRFSLELPDPSLIAFRLLITGLLLAGLLCTGTAWGKELRRSMGFIRPWLMGDAYVAVADESSTLFYNPAGLAGIKEDSAEVFNFQLNGDRRVKAAILDPDSLEGEFQGVDQAGFEDRLGETLYFSFNMRLPFIVQAESGWAYGLGLEILGFLEVLENPVLPGLRLEFFFDKVFFITRSYSISDNIEFGYTYKLINRIGIDRTFTFGELFALGATLDIENDQALKDAKDGKSFNALGLDLGFLYRIPVWEDWDPRIGLSFINIGGTQSQNLVRGMEFGERETPLDPPQAGELVQLNTIGFAVSPVAAGIRYTFSFDIVDFSQTALPGDDLEMRTRLGFEAGIGPKKDGTAILSILAGFNSGHFSAGLLSRVWIFEIGFGGYSVELGDEADKKKDRRFVFLFGVRI